jgi:hypothetical protein
MTKRQKDRQHNDQKKDRQHNDQKKKDRQHNDQKKKYEQRLQLNNTSTQLSFDYLDILCQQEVNRI